MGRSRGGLTTKIHAVTDARGLPITLKLTAGQAHDGRSADDMPGTIGRGQALLADAACDSNRLRDRLADIGAKAVIRPIPRKGHASDTRPRCLSTPQPDRALLLETQALQGYRNQIRKTRHQLPSPRETRRDTHLVACL